MAVLDSLTSAFAVIMIALPISHLASGAGFGAPAKLQWSIELWGAHRHPTQVYEVLAAAFILKILARSTALAEFQSRLVFPGSFLQFACIF